MPSPVFSWLTSSLDQYFIRTLRHPFSHCFSPLSLRPVYFQVSHTISVRQWNGMNTAYSSVVTVPISISHDTKKVHEPYLEFFQAHWHYTIAITSINFLIPKGKGSYKYSTVVSNHHFLVKRICSEPFNPCHTVVNGIPNVTRPYQITWSHKHPSASHSSNVPLCIANQSVFDMWRTESNKEYFRSRS